MICHQTHIAIASAAEYVRGTSAEILAKMLSSDARVAKALAVLRGMEAIGGLGLKLKIAVCGAVAAATVATSAMSDDFDIKSVQIQGVSELKAVEIAVSRPSEPKATYNVVAIGKGPEGSVISVNTRYSDMSGWVYTTRAIKCAIGKMKTLGSGETVAGMLKSKADPSWGPLIGGSSACQVAEIACSQSGKPLSGVR